LNGIWQAIGTAYWDIEGHAARPGPVVALGAVGAVPAGLGVVEGGAIPYQTWAAAKKKENAEKWLAADPEVKCYMPGVPRATYMPYPFQIFHSAKAIFFAYEYDGAVRNIYLKDPGPAPADSWMGQSVGHWEGDTLVVDVTGLDERTWFDRAGNFHSDALHVVERYTPISANALNYEATIEDAQVLARAVLGVLSQHGDEELALGAEDDGRPLLGFWELRLAEVEAAGHRRLIAAALWRDVQADHIGIGDQSGKVRRLEKELWFCVHGVKRLLRQRMRDLAAASGERGQRGRAIDRDADIGNPLRAAAQAAHRKHHAVAQRQPVRRQLFLLHQVVQDSQAGLVGEQLEQLDQILGDVVGERGDVGRLGRIRLQHGIELSRLRHVAGRKQI
jgi:hypothetical protein